MLFKSIKSTLTTMTAVAIVLVTTAVLIFTLNEHEKLYKDYVRSDLNGLSENMSNELKPMLVEDVDYFALANFLLKLDSYENVKYAIVYDAKWTQLQSYVGRAALIQGEIDRQLTQEDIIALPLGLTARNGELFAKKLVGDSSSGQGYLLLVNDFRGPLWRSKVSLFKQVFPLSFGVILLAILVSLGLQHKLLLPLNRLSRLAKTIQETNDYSIKIDVGGKEEVSDLCNNIANMMSTINAENTKNKHYTQQLMEQQKAMERLANFDALTGLPNRQFFMETLRIELAKAERGDNNIALMYFDLDGFKGINDSFGHDVGDQLLIQVSQRVKIYLRDCDLVSRLGGDEFLILLHNDPNALMLENIAQRLVSGLSQPFNINSWEVKVSASVGIAQAKDAKFNLSSFVSNADVAMYRSKVSGRAKHTFFIPEMMEDNKRKLLIANSVTHAISHAEFELYYQAKVSPQEKIIGFEALIRWHSRELGFVSPAEFIPIAENSGKVVDITRWVLERLCQDLPTIHKKYGKQVKVSVNLSAHDIKAGALIRYVEQLFVRYGVDPVGIEFEVTESAYLENFDVANAFFKSINELGSSIALDDFGTGYSSLGYLTQIDIQTLKIDKQFVDNLGMSDRSTLVTKTIIEMAKQLNLNICAEGVETKEQAEYLVNQGCQQLQGYLYSKPKPLSELGL